MRNTIESMKRKLRIEERQLRDHFAGLALQAIISKTPLTNYGVGSAQELDTIASTARGAIRYANELIKQLNEEK